MSISLMRLRKHFTTTTDNGDLPGKLPPMLQGARLLQIGLSLKGMKKTVTHGIFES